MSLHQAANDYLRAVAEEQGADIAGDPAAQAWLDRETNALATRLAETVTVYMSTEADPPPTEGAEDGV